MRFVHMADMHLDSKFIVLANKENLSQERRIEQRKVMKDIVEFIKMNNIPYFFIAGDLYEQEYIKESTIKYINSLFQTIPETQIFITPGNHDPYIANSFYKQYMWSSNVHIFKSELEIIETEDADIYGYGFSSFYMEAKYHKIEIKNPKKINILITHGSLDSSEKEQRLYNPINSEELKKMGFDYIALGHIHKKSYNDYEKQNIVYPGSTISLGFDELGDRGIIKGEIEKRKLNLEFIKINSKSFNEKEIDITDIDSIEELAENINLLDINEEKFYKIILVGKRNFDINLYELNSLIKKINIIKIKNNSTIKYDIEEIAKQSSLKGLFAKNILEKIQQASDEEKNKYINAFEIGMEVLNK